MKTLKYILYILPMIIFVIVFTIRENKTNLGTRKNPVKIFFTPSVDANKITTNAKTLINFLEKETGYFFETAVPASYIAVVEAFGTDRADIAVMNSFGYLLTNEKYGATAELRVVRANGETFYRGQIIARSDSKISSLEDLNGRNFAFVDPSSTSGYILPKTLLKNKGVVLAGETFAMKHDNVVTMVYQKQVDAGATFYSPVNQKTGEVGDARGRVIKQFPDVLEKIKILTLTDSIPNDPFVFRKGMNKNMMNKIKNAMLKFASTPDGQNSLYEIYSVVGLVATTDKDYDILRDKIKEVGKSLKELVK